MAVSKSFDAQQGLCEADEHLIALSDEVFSLFSDLIYRKSGITLGASKKGLLISRLTKRLIKHGAASFYAYYNIVKRDEGELVEMLNCISTNTTNFFREPHHFEYLRDGIVPDMLKKKCREKVMRIWSAGCSTGEEPYSIAITVNEVLRTRNIEPESWDIKILATDISTKVLDTAGAGIYGHEQLPDNMPKDMISRYFLRGINENDGKIKVKDFLKGMVRFGRLNFTEKSYPFHNEFDVIFFRNVMIYFDEDMKRHVLAMFHRHLCDNGHLFLGHSETMFWNEEFVPVHITVYRKK